MAERRRWLVGPDVHWGSRNPLPIGSAACRGRLPHLLCVPHRTERMATSLHLTIMNCHPVIAMTWQHVSCTRCLTCDTFAGHHGGDGDMTPARPEMTVASRVILLLHFCPKHAYLPVYVSQTPNLYFKHQTLHRNKIATRQPEGGLTWWVLRDQALMIR